MLDYTILKDKKCWIITTEDYTCGYKKYFDEGKIVMGLGSDFDLSEYIDSRKDISHKFKLDLDNFIKMSKNDYVAWNLNRVAEEGTKIYRENNCVIGQIKDDLKNIYKFEQGKGHILPINIIERRTRLFEKCDIVDCYKINKINDMKDFKYLKDFEKLSDQYNNFFIRMKYFGLENIQENDSNEIIINLNKLKYGNNEVLEEVKNFSKGDFLLGEFISKRDKFECRRVICKVKEVYLDNDKRIVLDLISSKCNNYEYSALIDIYEYEYGEDLINKNIRTHKNIIFYGPPGTGKTYNIDNEVLKIISISKYEKLKENRKELHNELRRLQVDNKVRFCTFHQSYGYEEFIEGLRPNDEGNFTLEDGLLKQIAIDAMFEGLTYELKADLIEELSCEAKNNISNEQKKELVLRYINDSSKFDFLNCDQYVLVIDEINRGNISKIFGEAFTLLEEDKRLGSENEVVLKLPYSKEDFTLPPNLHFIGTMNSSDKSIAPIDIALRRRFRFREIMPDENILSVVDGIDLCELLKKINDRIEYLYDRDHMIGHAYFIGCSCLDDIARVILYKIIPLLQEYFYEEWDKIGLILGGVGSSKDGDYIIYKEELNPEYLFKNNAEYGFNTQNRYYIKDEITAVELRKIYE
ncbi:AAA family ATPase [Clostridiaceae bacterium UIB06]|uniref:AAA family ATPase n=1 Tax=Clostridium thailandense TaxID=2794346 RepID=A0A949WRA7_9CLOT|nr:AAA family ATPase [Clostridium thailandense]MBV7273756.1 AAA family ATPase [Clostridium thailandense]MCH5137464.1 AAA family ATPase [Clostridiaceae bacterium UIB06]